MNRHPSADGATPPQRAGVAARKRQVVRDELGEAALRLIASRGFDETTVDEIVAAAGVSRRTFFRYFASKEDVVVELLGDLGAELGAALRGRPADEPVVDSLRVAMADVMRHATDDHGPKPRRLATLILQTPSLRARYLARQDQWHADLVRIVVERAYPGPDVADGAEDPPPELLGRAAAQVGVALVAFDLALRDWALSGAEIVEESLDTALERTFARVRSAVTPDRTG